MRRSGIVEFVECRENRWMVKSGEEADLNSPGSSPLKENNLSRWGRKLTVTAGGCDCIRSECMLMA